MNIKTLFKILLLFFSAMGFGSCGSDDDEKKEIYPLSFEKEYYEVPLLGNQSISIRGGNRNYSVTVEKNRDLGCVCGFVKFDRYGKFSYHPEAKKRRNHRYHKKTILLMRRLD